MEKKPKGIHKKEELFKNKGIIVYRFGIDTVYLTVDDSRDDERAEIKPISCEFYGDGNNANDYYVELDIESPGGNPSNSEKKIYGDKWDKAIRLDKIMLIPVPDTEE